MANPQPTPASKNTPPPTGAAKKKKAMKPKVQEIPWDDMVKMIADNALTMATANEAISQCETDDDGREKNPKTDLCGKTLVISQKLAAKFKKDMKEFSGMTPSDTIANKIDTDLTEIRRLSQQISELARSVLDDLPDATQYLEDQQALYAARGTLDVKIEAEEEAIRVKQERVAKLKAAKQKAAKK